MSKTTLSTPASKTGNTNSTITSSIVTSRLASSSVNTTETTTLLIYKNSTVSSNSSPLTDNTTSVVSIWHQRQSDTKSSSEFIGAVAGGTIAAVVLVVLAIVTAVVLVRRRRRMKEKSESDYQPTGSQTIERQDLGKESYVNVILEDGKQVSMECIDTDPVDQAIYLNRQVANKYITNTDTYYVQKDVPVIVTPDKDSCEFSKYDNCQGLQNNEFADIRLKKSNLLTVDSDVNNPYSSLRSQTSDVVNHYNTFHEFCDNVQEINGKPQEQNLGDITGSGKGDIGRRIFPDSNIPVTCFISSNILNQDHTIAQQNEYGNCVQVEEKIPQKETKTDKNQRKKAKNKADNSHSSLPINQSAEDNVNVYRNNRIYNNL